MIGQKVQYTLRPVDAGRIQAQGGDVQAGDALPAEVVALHEAKILLGFGPRRTQTYADLIVTDSEGRAFYLPAVETVRS
ncbi:hypothetical protein DLJ47_01850 [Micromonospora sp. S4605]|uniref:hypothetical protein n=1 Tax=Micromonospora sp. S4605 TaxID=1420897 RepID=UPI000D6EF87C|nr:hypothetical protein [Micromonospora sp. S4605]PWU57676.1 hypothetical protein DLJ47_01850 [Micromonospora sp. S4605]